MPQAKYQLGDFLAMASDKDKVFVNNVHETLMEKGYKPKIQVTKTDGLRIAYHQPKTKTVAGIVSILLFHNGNLTIRIYPKNYKSYPETLNALPESMVNQINQAPDCIKFADPNKCWKGCGGYDLLIRGNTYQKCITACFQLSIDDESISHLLEIIQKETTEREKTNEI
ncbi:MAG: hypothetical protein FWD97_10005 [Defluviitaleaceae bacterium]|nr:hypothetical protein [Defluviitaleaceae bacterium]